MVSAGYIATTTVPDIFVEGERDALGERDRLLCHAVLDAFAVFDGRDTDVCGFSFRILEGLALPCVESAFARPPSLVVREALASTYPDQAHLLRNPLQRDDGSIRYVGMAAQDITRHPYVMALLGAEGPARTSRMRLELRLEGVRLAGLPGPSPETLERMQARLAFEFGHKLRSCIEHQTGHLRSIHTNLHPGRVPDDWIRHFTPAVLMDGLDAEHPDVGRFPQRRALFLARYPAAADLFRPYPPPSDVLEEMRRTVQECPNAREVDDRLKALLGEAAWDRFRTDPHRFIHTSIELFANQAF